MHEYLLYTVLDVVVLASDHKDLFVECVTIFAAKIIELIWVSLVE
jgi:hypothetical protein